jgi:hypothetical protein
VPRILRSCIRWLPVLALLAAWPALAGPIEDRLADALRDLDTRSVSTGVLAERVVPVVDLGRFDGGLAAQVATRRTWLQAYQQLARAAADPTRRPSAEALVDRPRLQNGAVPIGMVFDRYERIRPDAIERGALRVRDGRLQGGGPEAFERRTAFLAAALGEVSYRGGEMAFVLDREATFSNAGVALDRVAIDFDDGRGYRAVDFDRPVTVHYARTGIKTVRVEARAVDGETLHASFAFVVAALATRIPTTPSMSPGPFRIRAGWRAGTPTSTWRRGAPRWSIRWW